MIKTMKRKIIRLSGACALLLASCTNLDPDIYSDMTIAPNFEPVLKQQATDAPAEEVAAE